MKNFFSRLWKHIIKWNEYITIPVALVLWMLSPRLLHWVDPTSAVYDAGIFQIILFTIIAFFILHGIVWLTIKWTWPGMYNFLDNILEQTILGNGNLTFYEKCKITLWIFSVYLIGIILISRVI